VKLTNQQLKQVIKEELDILISEGLFDFLSRNKEEHPLDKYGSGDSSKGTTPAQPKGRPGSGAAEEGPQTWFGVKFQGSRSGPLDVSISKNALEKHKDWWFLSLKDPKTGKGASVDDVAGRDAAVALKDELIKSGKFPTDRRIRLEDDPYENLWNFRNGRPVNEVTITKQQLKQIVREGLMESISTLDASTPPDAQRAISAIAKIDTSAELSPVVQSLFSADERRSHKEWEESLAAAFEQILLGTGMQGQASNLSRAVFNILKKMTAAARTAAPASAEL
jgi:hypothetical protein